MSVTTYPPVIAADGGGVIKITTADVSRSSDNTLADDGTLVNFTLEPATYYIVEMSLIVDTSSSSTPDFKFLFQASNALAGGWIRVFNTDSDGGLAVHFIAKDATYSGAFDATKTHQVEGFGTFLSHATLSSVVDLQWAQANDNATATTVQAGSWLRFTPV